MAIGAGWQGAVGIVNVVCYYAIGIPIGALLAYVANLSVRVRVMLLCQKFFIFISKNMLHILNLVTFDLY